MKTLKLFNAVLSKDNGFTEPFISEEGYIIESNARWAQSSIIDYYLSETLNGNDLNKTFHKSWKVIKNSSRCELLIEQIKHYISTYGSDFKSEIYIPDEVLNLPDVKKLTYKVIKAYTKDELIKKCLDLLKSGIALKEETIIYILSLLIDELSYTFTGKENIKNKEAITILAETYNILPKDTMEFFRFVIFKATGQSLLIKNKETINSIKESSFIPTALFTKFGITKLAEIFNRYKPLFLAFKNKSPKTINKISKLSKKYHKPLAVNPLNVVTSELLFANDKHWLVNATPFALFKALSACHNRIKGQDSFVYKIRNGKSWVEENKISKKICKHNFHFILDVIQSRFDFTDKKFFFSNNVKYALPTSEKLFVGNIPTGTRFIGNKLAVGIYWKNEWGSHDLDLSGINIGGKIGWNASYNQNDGDLMFSGDITYAPDGAVEYLYANKGLVAPTLVKNNVYSGSHTSGYKIIIGVGDKISKEYMFNPDNLFADIKCESVQKQTILGILIPRKNKQCFVLLNFGAGHSRVSGSSEISNIATKALYQQWSKPFSFKRLIKLLNGTIVYDVKEADYNFELSSLEKDSFINIFKNEKT